MLNCRMALACRRPCWMVHHRRNRLSQGGLKKGEQNTVENMKSHPKMQKILHFMAQKAAPKFEDLTTQSGHLPCSCGLI